MDVDCQTITLLHSAHRYRTALRVEKGEFQFRSRTILFAGDNTAESVFGLDRHDVTGIDCQHRLGIGPVNVMVLTLSRDWEFVVFAGASLRKAALRHDRTEQPAIVDH